MPTSKTILAISPKGQHIKTNPQALPGQNFLLNRPKITNPRLGAGRSQFRKRQHHTAAGSAHSRADQNAEEEE